MLTPEQKSELKQALVQKCIDKNQEPYYLKKDAAIVSLFSDKSKSWEDVHKGSFIGLDISACYPVTQRPISYRDTHDTELPLYIVKDIAIVDDDIIIETVGGKILSTIDLQYDWRSAKHQQELEQEKELVLGAIKEDSMLSKIYTQQLCKELGIKIPKEHRAEILAHLPSVIKAEYDEMCRKQQEFGEGGKYSHLFKRTLSDSIHRTIKNFDLILQQQQADAIYQYCIESTKPVIGVQGKLFMFDNKISNSLSAHEQMRRGQSFHVNGFGTNCKSVYQGKVPIIGDETVVYHYTSGGHYLLETKDAIYTNMQVLQEKVREHSAQQREEEINKRWSQSPIGYVVEPDMFTKYGGLPVYPTSDESHLLDLASESLPSGFNRAYAFHQDSWMLDRKIERYEEQLNHKLTNIIQECAEKGIPIIKWNSSSIDFKNLESSNRNDFILPIPYDGQTATLPNHCLMLDANGEWTPISLSQDIDIFVGDTLTERNNFIMITDKGLITNYPIDEIVERVFDMNRDIQKEVVEHDNEGQDISGR